MKTKKISVVSIMLASIFLLSMLAHAEILSIGAEGNDGINNIIREDDFIKLTATVSIANDPEITKDQVLWGPSNPFTSCEKVVTGYKCVARIPQTGT